MLQVSGDFRSLDSLGGQGRPGRNRPVVQAAADEVLWVCAY